MNLVILFILSIGLLGFGLESYAVEFIDNAGHIPDWAINAEQEQIILKCQSDDNSEKDTDWCLEYLESLLIELKSNPIIKEIESRSNSELVIPAPFIDQTKDPQHYIDRYNNEPKYKVWFDENYPQYISIYEAVGLPEPIVTQTNESEYTPEPGSDTETKYVSEEEKTQAKEFGDDYYVDEDFGFAIKIPKGAEIDNEAITVDNSRALVQFDFGGDDNFLAGFNIQYFHEDPNLIPYDNLLYYFSEIPQSSGGEYTQQIKINNEKMEEQEDRSKVTYEFAMKRYYPEDYFDTDMAGKTLTHGIKIVIFVYPNGDYYSISFTSLNSSYSTDVKTFDSVVDTFYAGDVKKISSSTGNSNSQTNDSSKGGGCLIATATYGTELAPQVQLLREIRDNNLLNTESGTAFMGTFNDIYYSFSPTIADMERQSPIFKEIVKAGLTPMLSTLSIMENANSESEVLGLGLSVIVLNLAMYIGVPSVVIIGIRKRF